jgi:hypothetical protein
MAKGDIRKALGILLVGSVIVSACTDKSAETTDSSRTQETKIVKDVIYTIPSDPYGRYKFLKMSKMGTNLMVVTERIGKGGALSYSTREINCNKGTFRYLATGDTIDEMTANFSKTRESMGALSEGSISSYVAGHACDAMHDKGGYKYRTNS